MGLGLKCIESNLLRSIHLNFEIKASHFFKVVVWKIYAKTTCKLLAYDVVVAINRDNFVN